MASAVQKTRHRATVRQSTITEYFICPFDFRAYARRHELDLAEMARDLNIAGSNFHNWEKQIPDFLPLSVAKALIVTREPEAAPAFEKLVDGLIMRRKRALFVSERGAELARRYDTMRAGTRLKMDTGEELILMARPTIAATGETERSLTLVADTAEHEVPGTVNTEPEPIPEPIPEVLAATFVPPAPRTPTVHTLQTPAGTVTIEMPAQELTMGEREIMTSLVLRLNSQLAEVHRQNHELLVMLKSTQSEASGLRGRVKELVDERRDIIDLARTTAAKGVVTIHTATQPKVAKIEDYKSVTDAIRHVPELARLVDEMMRQTKSVEAGSAAAGFSPGAVSTLNQH